jgi:hypothetical protein
LTAQATEQSTEMLTSFEYGSAKLSEAAKQWIFQ